MAATFAVWSCAIASYIGALCCGVYVPIPAPRRWRACIHYYSVALLPASDPLSTVKLTNRRVPVIECDFLSMAHSA